MASTDGTDAKPVSFRILNVRNLDATITATDISKLFGFHETPFLRKFACVEINGEGEDRHAKVVCPDVSYDEIIKLNGIEYYGKNLVIQGENDDIEESTERTADTQNDDISNDSGENNDDIIYMLLDCRNYPDLNFEPVKEMEVCAALHLEHADDPHKAVKTYRGQREGTFGIESTNMARYVGTHLVIRGHEIKLVPVRRRQIGQHNKDNKDNSSIKDFLTPTV